MRLVGRIRTGRHLHGVDNTVTGFLSPIRLHQAGEMSWLGSCGDDYGKFARDGELGGNMTQFVEIESGKWNQEINS